MFKEPEVVKIYIEKDNSDEIKAVEEKFNIFMAKTDDEP
jgi:hypothetical protein